jgi:chromosome segregation ATPase
MKLPFVSRRRYDDDLAEMANLRRRIIATEERHDEAEEERRQAVGELAEVEGKRRRLAGWLADEKTTNKHLDEELQAVRIVNGRLTEDLTELREQLTEARAQLTDGAMAEVLAKARREKRRADRLQKQYDDAVGLGPGRIEDSRSWQPGYKADAS